MEIVKLIGSDVLPEDQKLVIETAKVIRVGFLQQNAYHADRHLCAPEQAAADDAGHPASVRQGQGVWSTRPSPSARLLQTGTI